MNVTGVQTCALPIYLEGKLTITFTGLEAMQRRLEQRNEDAPARKKFLEEEAKEYIPAACEVDLTNKPDWGSSSSSLTAEYALKSPGWVSGAGRKALLPMGIFSAAEKHVFDHAERHHPVYFQFPFQNLDDVTLALPSGWSIGSLPPVHEDDKKAAFYNIKAENDKEKIHLTRKIDISMIMLDVKQYSTLRSFFQSVRTGDE